MDDSSILRELIASDSSSSSASSMATVSDQAGAGRTLYKALRVAGQAVEQQLNRLASRWRPDAQTNSVNIVTMFSPAYSLGEWDDETHSNNETASDLPGAGRTLGLLYSSAGRRIERHSNRAASALGKGPDAVVKRIYERMPSVPLEDRRVFIVKQSLRSKGKFIGDCQKLLAYTLSDVPSTRHRALEHIASLVVSEPLLRSLFNQLHAITTIRDYRPRSYVCSLDDRDVLLSCSRIALISLSEVEVNKVAKELMLRIRPTEENIDKLLDYARHPELSFLALRHLQQSPSFVALTESTFVRFAGIVASCSDLPEWKVVDNIIWTLLEFFFPPLDSSFEDVRRALIKTIILKAERLPRSLHALKRLSSFIDRPDICDNSEIAFRPYSILSSIISDRPGRLDPRKLEHLKDMFPTECLQPLWDSLSGPEMLLVTMMIERNALFQKSSWTGVDLVSDLSKLQEWCQDLSTRIMNPSSALSTRAIRTIEYVVRLDRYCCKAMFNALSETWASTQNHVFADLAKRIWGLSLVHPYPVPHTPKWSGPCYKDLFIYRHWAQEEGAYHIIPKRHVRQRPVCPRCACRNVDSEYEVLSLCSRDILLLDVHPGAPFSTTGHHPIIAFWNNSDARRSQERRKTEPEYLAFAQIADREIYYRTSICERAGSIRYWNDENELIETDRFYVPVLRWDILDVPRRESSRIAVSDSTGTYSWVKCRSSSR